MPLIFPQNSNVSNYTSYININRKIPSLNKKNNKYLSDENDIRYYNRINYVKLFITSILSILLYLCFVVPNWFPDNFYSLTCCMTGIISVYDTMIQFYSSTITDDDFKEPSFFLKFMVFIGCEKNRHKIEEDDNIV